MCDQINEAQKMWIEVITNVVNSSGFNEKIGDMNYVLGNMIAKYLNSSSEYNISVMALKHIKK